MKTYSKILIVFTTFGLILIVSFNRLPHQIPNYEPQMDRERYVSIAEGKLGKVRRPFIKRILHPFLAGSIQRITPLNMEKSFFALALLSLALLIMVLLQTMMRTTNLNPALILPMLFTPYISLIYYDYYMHDLFYAMILALLLFAYVRNIRWLTVFLIIPLFLAREATLLLSIVLCVISFYKKDYKFLAGILVATSISLLISSYFSSLGMENKHGMSELLYIFSKIIYNTLSNFLGITLWMDSHDHCISSYTIQVPQWLSFDTVHQVGICSFEFSQAMHTFWRYLTTFGIGPLILFFTVYKKKNEILKNAEPWLLTVLSFGLISFLIGPCLGPGGFRLIGYGWPAFWIALPVLVSRYYCFNRRDTHLLISAHVLLSWLPELSELLGLSISVGYSLVSIIAVGTYLFCVKIIRRSLVE